MRLSVRTVTLLLLLLPAAFAENQEKAEKKALEQQAKTFVKEAKDLEKAGKLQEARTYYTNSQSFTDSNEATQAIKRIDGEMHKRLKKALQQARQLYDKGKYAAAAQVLEEASKLGGSGSVIAYNLALCNQRTGDLAAALGQLDQAALATADPKRRLKIRQLRTTLATGEQASVLKNDERERINRINQLIEAIGFEASVEESAPAPRQPTESGAAVVPASLRNSALPVVPNPRKAMHRSVSLCQALAGVTGAAAQTPAIVFNQANCAEDNDRPAEASQLLDRYLTMAPKAADADRVRLRIAKLNALAALPEPKGAQVGLFTHRLPASWRSGSTAALWWIFSRPPMPLRNSLPPSGGWR